jgi:transcriptional regulator with XRE-family HTH domain
MTHKFSFKKALNLAMIIMDVTNQDLEEKIGISASAISAYKSGANNNPTLDTIKKISDGLGLSLTQFLSYGEFK